MAIIEQATGLSFRRLAPPAQRLRGAAILIVAAGLALSGLG